MNLHIPRSLATAASLAAAISLLGCGGGSSTSDATTPVEPAPTPESPAPTLTVPTGMTASAVSGVQARNARDTIETLLPRPAIRFAPVSARSRTDEFHVTSISSDGNNGFSVTFVLRGQESTVHFKADDFRYFVQLSQ